MNDSLLEKIKEYSDKVQPFDPGSTYIPVDGSVQNGDESCNLISFILGDDKDYLKSFTVKFMDYMGYGHLNITSNALASHIIVMKALTSPLLEGRALKAGDEIITVPSNVGIINAARMFGITPVVTDVDLDTMLPDPISIETLVVEGRTKAIVLPTSFGNSCNGEIIRDISEDFGITYVEDVGYGLGSKSFGMPVGSFADISMFSFHSDLLGDAGVILSKSHLHHKIMQDVMEDSTNSAWLGLGGNPMVYAYLSAQIDKMDFYTSMRRLNWNRLRTGLGKHQNWFRFQTPQQSATPSWTGFTVTIKEPAPFTKQDLMAYLEEHKIGTRSVVGNVFQFYTDVVRDGEELINSDYIHRNTFVIGCNPTMRQEHIDWIVKTFDNFIGQHGHFGKKEIKD